MRWAGNIARMGGNRNVYGILVGKQKRKRPLGKPKLAWRNRKIESLVYVL
jgi:hypothetical protein